jgi:hypothetical protein
MYSGTTCRGTGRFSSRFLKGCDVSPSISLGGLGTHSRICYGGPQPQGVRPQSGGYSFYSSKRHAKALVGGATPKECQKVDTFKHENGQQYNITGMSDNQVEELLALAQNGTATADFPEVFKALEKSE